MNLQRFEAALTDEADGEALPLRKRVIAESVRQASVFASCCYRQRSPFELNVRQLSESFPLERFFRAMFLVEQVKTATLNQQVTRFLKILSLPGPQSPLVPKTPSC